MALWYCFSMYCRVRPDVHSLPAIPKSSGIFSSTAFRILSCSSSVRTMWLPSLRPYFFRSRELSPSRWYAVHISLARFCRTPVNSSISFPVFPNFLSRTTRLRISLCSSLPAFLKSISLLFLAFCEGNSIEYQQKLWSLIQQYYIVLVLNNRY